jgi:hypothetical protein
MCIADRLIDLHGFQSPKSFEIRNLVMNNLMAPRHVRSIDEIRELGLQALQEKLGKVGMIRFLQQFETGSGDYTKERREWVDRTSLADLRKAARIGKRSARKKTR